MKAHDDIVCSIAWILLYRASISGYQASGFHLACDGMGKCVDFVKAENGRIAASYNEDGFTSKVDTNSPNLKSFIASVDKNGGCGDTYHRNDIEEDGGFFNFAVAGPCFNDDLGIF